MADPLRTLYQVPDRSVKEIKISPGIMLLVLRREDGTGHVPLRLLSIESGATLVELRVRVRVRVRVRLRASTPRPSNPPTSVGWLTLSPPPG